MNEERVDGELQHCPALEGQERSEHGRHRTKDLAAAVDPSSALWFRLGGDASGAVV